jgi:hypothetical protein
MTHQQCGSASTCQLVAGNAAWIIDPYKQNFQLMDKTLLEEKCALLTTLYLYVTTKYTYLGKVISYLVEYAFLGNAISVAQLPQ